MAMYVRLELISSQNMASPEHAQLNTRCLAKEAETTQALQIEGMQRVLRKIKVERL